MEYSQQQGLQSECLLKSLIGKQAHTATESEWLPFSWLVSKVSVVVIQAMAHNLPNKAV